MNELRSNSRSRKRESFEWRIRQRSRGLTCVSRASRRRRTAFFIFALLYNSVLVLSSIYASCLIKYLYNMIIIKLKLLSIVYNTLMSIEELYKEFANNVRAERARKGLKQAELADFAQISKDTVWQIENAIGNPTFYSIVSIALALDVDLNTLLPLKK